MTSCNSRSASAVQRTASVQRHCHPGQCNWPRWRSREGKAGLELDLSNGSSSQMTELIPSAIFFALADSRVLGFTPGVSKTHFGLLDSRVLRFSDSRIIGDSGISRILEFWDSRILGFSGSRIRRVAEFSHSRLLPCPTSRILRFWDSRVLGFAGSPPQIWASAAKPPSYPRARRNSRPAHRQHCSCFNCTVKA